MYMTTEDCLSCQRIKIIHNVFNESFVLKYLQKNDEKEEFVNIYFNLICYRHKYFLYDLLNDFHHIVSNI